MQKLTRLARSTALFGAGAAMVATSMGALLLTPTAAFAGVGPSTTLSSTSTTQPARTGDNPMPVTLSFSSGVTGVTPSMINVANGTVSNFTSVSSTTYTFKVTPITTGSVSVDFNGSQVQDASSNGNIAAPQLQFIYDNTLPNTTNPAPTVTITGGPADGSTITTPSATFTFTTTNASTVNCSFGSNPASYSCGSPQTFNNLVNGTYPFTVVVQNSANVSASTTRSFTVNLGSTSTSTSTTTPPTNTSSTPSTNNGGGGPLLLPNPNGGPVQYFTPGSGTTSSTATSDNTTTTSAVVPPASFNTTVVSSTPNFADHPGLVSGAGGRLEAAALLAGAIPATTATTHTTMPAVDNTVTAPVTTQSTVATSSNASTTAGGLTDNNGTPPANNAADNSQAAGLGFLSPSSTSIWFTIGLLAVLLLGGSWYAANRNRHTMA